MEVCILGDFRQPKSMLSINKALLSKMRDYSLKSKLEESCGLVVKSGQGLEFVPCINECDNREDMFRISHIKMLSHDVRFIFHSHPSGSARPSKFDIMYSNEIGIPFLIYSVPDDNFNLYTNKRV